LSDSKENNKNFWNMREQRNRRPRNPNEVVRRRIRRQRRDDLEENQLILENKLEALCQEITQKRLQTLAFQEVYNNQLDRLARLRAEIENLLILENAAPHQDELARLLAQIELLAPNGNAHAQAG